ncbi:MAG TPA: FAD-linked oxidase C-terminal domain-containing protein [Polyangia bacterium]|jgi:glycolate oxidase|nr:FAD-linked oxidase C-terminal domain-containing protein [Polyangia bacterium]
MSHPSSVSAARSVALPATPARPEVVARLAAIVGARQVIHDPAQLATYESDGLASFRARPGLVALPASTDEVVAVMKLAREVGMPVVPRGAGTGLSGGALPTPGCLVLSLARMTRVLEIDVENGFMRVQPGVINLEVSRRLAPFGYYYAPDPSSQSVCTVGGNLAENSGGAHCLKYGFTTNHVRGVRLVTAEGEVVDLGGPVLDAPGYDLLGVLVGSEGTLGVATEIVLRVLRRPEATRTFFAAFASTTQAGACVSEIIARGIVPAAIEMMDRLAIEAAIRAVAVDWPIEAPRVGAALLMDVDGPLGEVEHTAREALAIAERAGAVYVRVPRDEDERALMWKGRKSAFAAMGRMAPNYIVQDGVIPRTEIARVLAEIQTLADAAGLRVANVFHAGDGNLHPLVLFDARVAGQEQAAEALSGEILRICIRAGGSITGEHGVGADKAPYMAEMFSEADLDTMAKVRCAFDPETLCNPHKIFPTPRLCGDRPGVYRPHASERAGLADRA